MMRERPAGEKSLLSRFGFYTSVLMLFFLLAFASVYMGLRRLDVCQRLFLERTLAQEEVSRALDGVEVRFAAWRNSQGAGDLQACLEQCRELQERLADYRGYTSDCAQTQGYIRRLEGFCVYTMGLLEDIPDSGRERYEQAAYVGNAIDLHQAAVREMGETDLGYARKSYERQILRMMKLVKGLALAAFFCVAAFALWSGRVFVFLRRTVRLIVEHLKGLTSCNWDLPDLSIDDYEEFERLSRTLNRMKHQIRDYVAQVERDRALEVQLQKERLANEQQRAELVTAQMSALRAQVNPHFLFNALNMIGASALVDSPQTVMQLVEATGKILRYSLYTADRLVLLDDEIGIVEQYLFLQKHRFGEGLEVRVDNCLEGEGLRIPPMTVQPLVENCFKHGFCGQKDFRAAVSVTMEQGQIVIRVKDNGTGFPENAPQGGGGIGLSNIARRMRLQYGEAQEYLSVDSRPGNTEVVLRIPMKEAECHEADDR